MNIALVFTLMALALVVVFATLATSRNRSLPDVNRAAAAIQELDVAAFRNLVDPEEEAFLRARLPSHEFGRIKRERNRAALAYVRALSSASLQFARFGDAARRSPDPAIAASGKQIANSAIYLRLRALDATMKLTVSAMFPDLYRRPLGSLVDQYDQAAYLLQNHNGLQRARRHAS